MEYFFSGLYDMSQSGLANKRNITAEQVLQQRTGIEWDETSTDYRNQQNSANQMIQSDDWYRFTLSRPLDAQPGTTFTYSSGVSTLMSRLVRVASGMGPEAFATAELFSPLGFGPVHWEGYSEGGMGTGITEWPLPDEDVPLGFGLWLRARDMVKFGELYLNGGVHNGQRILDQSWIDASWTLYSHSGNSETFPAPGWGHGYQWWAAILTDTSNRDWHVYFASGWGSQVIFIVPELNLVVVTVADNYDYNGPDVDAMMINHIVPELNPYLDSRFDGSWYNPATDGQGFNLEVRDERGSVVSYWYTYDDSGNQRWFLLVGPVEDGVGVVEIYATRGGVFLEDDPIDLQLWGNGRIAPFDCDHVDFEFESDIEAVSGTIPLTRLSGKCFEPPAVN
jgi:CubicO group peptidase (beta-lactamase class C family)